MVRRIPILGISKNLAINDTFRGSLKPHRRIDASLYIQDQYRWRYYGGRWRYEIITPATVYLFQVRIPTIQTIYIYLDHNMYT